jgi:predicted NBD/HSP70 family sugar kinase
MGRSDRTEVIRLDFKETNNTYLGIDLGGTKLLVGEADASGRLLGCKKYPSGYLDQKQALKCITDAVDDYMENRSEKELGQVLAMGLGLVGRVDSESGTWFQIDKQRTEEIPLAELLSKRYNLPCTIDNDVRSATRAEMRFGFGQTTRNFIYVNVGTGLAAGIVTGGRIVRGGHFNSGEVGHVQVGVKVGVPCACGRIDCVESIAAGTGIDMCARLLLPKYPDTLLQIPDGAERVNVREVFEKADADPLCGLLTDNAARGIANLIMNLARTTDPDTVVLGGGVVADGILFPRIEKYLHANTMRFVTGGVKLTKLDPDRIGLLGACTLAMEAFDRLNSTQAAV